MRATRRLIVMLFCAGPCLPACAAVGIPLPQPGAWGREAVALHNAAGRRSAAKSPDSIAAVYPNGPRLALRRADVDVALPIPFTPGLAEASWSQGSRYAAVTTGVGGAAGRWDAYLVDTVRLGRIVRIRDALKPQDLDPACPADAVNVGAVGWAQPQLRLFLVVDTARHARCARAGQMAGLVLDLPTMAVVERLSSADVRLRWKALLGTRFRD